MSPVRVSYYSDVLCVWAYVAQHRLDQLVKKFGDELSIESHFCSVFPDTKVKMDESWKARGAYQGFNRHINDVAQQFPDIEIHERLWLETRPRTSASGHLFLKTIELIEVDSNASETKPQSYFERISTRAARALRKAFFAQAKDISDWKVHAEIAEGLGVDYRLVEEKIRTSEAISQLALDYSLRQKNGVEVSPTFIMNDGRQRLVGNVGYRLLEANVQELVRSPAKDAASWC